ncbi:serine hydrolase domain-containing protein [Empedobacter tilapiae]|nr:serine hydrolase domain-containing protein [Empedobacter tilapiae]
MNHIKYNYFTLLILLVFTTKIYSQTNIPSKIDSLMKWSNENGMFNGNVLVAKNGNILYNSSFGYADASKTTKLTPDYKFNIGSITKEFSAVALQQLKEKGKLNLNDKISTFFPELPKWSNDVTINNLLQYTSGIPDVNWKKIKNNKDIFEDLKSIDTLDFTPGTKYDYNNNNFFLRLAIIEKITGLEYKDYVDKYIFKPYKMNSAEITPIQKDKKIAKGFNDKLIEDKPDILVGGAFITTVDLLKFLNQLHSNKIITQESVYQLGQHFQEDSQSALGEVKFRNKKIVEHIHDGRGGNYDAIIISDVEHKFDIILLSNNYQGKIFEISDAIVAILKNKNYTLPQKENIQNKE